jgi:transcriptional regulator with XRE-family HTH domain
LKTATFGQLVRELRKTTSDAHGNRWTRETLSKHSHLSIDQLGRLERGDRKYYDHQTLALLAEAFRLTPAEKREFLIIASGIIDVDLYHRLDHKKQLETLINIASNMLVPVFIVDAFQDLLAVNRSCLGLMGIDEERVVFARQQKVGFNNLYYIYSSTLGFKDLIGPSWREIALLQIYKFRRSSLRFRHHDYFKLLINELLKETQFDIDWYSANRHTLHHYSEYENFNYEHPLYGPLKYITTETRIETFQGELQLYAHNPFDDQTNRIFEKLNQSDNPKMIRLASWPDKDL